VITRFVEGKEIIEKWGIMGRKSKREKP